MTDDRHPEELLAAYVDGTLGDRERAAVEAHLATCGRCREESALAMRASSELRRLPEEPVPFGVMNPVVAEIGRRMSSPSRRLSQRVLLAAGGAIAAAFVGVLAVWLLPSVGGNAASSGAGVAAPEASATAGESGAGIAFAPAAVPLEHDSESFDDAALAQLATSTADDAASGRFPNATRAAGPVSAETRAATACLAKGAAVEPQDVLIRLIQARYQGKPAFIGVYLTGPGAGRSPTGILVWVVRSDTCGFLSFTSQRI